jgi:predicted kinase
MAGVARPSDSRVDDEVPAPEEATEKKLGDDLGERAERLGPAHPSDPRHIADRTRPGNSPDSDDSAAPDRGVDRTDAKRMTDPDGGSPDYEHAERDKYVAAALADAHRAGLATDREYVIDVKRRIWTADRSEMHGEIVRDLYAKADGVPCEGKAILAGGLPGAGKTSVLGGVAGIDRSRYLMINPDDIKEELAKRGMVPEIKGLSPMEASDLAHEESSDVAKRLAIRAYADKKNVIWDVTMSSLASTQRRITDLKSEGYEHVEGIFVAIPVDVSVQRAENRHREGQDQCAAGHGLGGRYLPPDRIQSLADEKFGSINRAVFEQVKPEFNRWRIYDNSVDGSPARLAEDSVRGHHESEEGR